MATFGNTSAGANHTTRNSSTLTASKFTLSEAGDLTSMSLYCVVASGTSHLKLAVYDDSGGSPNNLEGVTNEITITNTTPGYQTANFSSPVTLAAGTYWLAFMQDAGATGFEFYYNDLASGDKINSGTTYPTFPTPYASNGTEARDISIYATYTPFGSASVSPSASKSPSASASASASRSLSPSSSGSPSASPSSSVSPSPSMSVSHTLSVDQVEICFLIAYKDKYSGHPKTYQDKYTSQNRTYSNAYTVQSNSYKDTYTSKTGQC